MPVADPPPDASRHDLRAFAQRVLVGIGLVAAALLVVRLAGVVVLVFGGIVVATVLRALADLLVERLRVPERAAVPLAAIAIAAAIGLAAWALGEPVGEQLSRLRTQLPAAVDALERWLDERALGRELLAIVGRVGDDLGQNGVPWQRVAGFASITLNAVAGVLLMLVLGIYLAADPALYRRGVLRLAPPRWRPRLDDALRAAGHGLARWLMGQGVSMLFIGTATTIGLALVEVPLAPALGLIAGALAFVPFFGSITAGLISVLIGFVEGPRVALQVALVFVAIQQLEEYVLLPFIHRWAVALPPALGLAAPLIFGLLFGLVGAVLATPLIVVTMILVQRLYVEEALEGKPGIVVQLPE